MFWPNPKFAPISNPRKYRSAKKPSYTVLQKLRNFHLLETCNTSHPTVRDKLPAVGIYLSLGKDIILFLILCPCLSFGNPFKSHKSTTALDFRIVHRPQVSYTRACVCVCVCVCAGVFGATTRSLDYIQFTSYIRISCGLLIEHIFTK